MSGHRLFNANLNIFNSLFYLLTFLYYKFIIWVCYFIIILFILIQPYNIINSIELLLIIYIFYSQVSENINAKEIRYEDLLKKWNLFLRVVSFMTIARYIFDFTSLSLLHERLNRFELYNFIQE